MTAPTRHMATVEPNIHRSVWRGGALIRPFAGLVRRLFFGEIPDELLKDASAMLVTLKLVEARAGGSQQDRVAGLRAFGGDFHGARHGARPLHGNDAAELRFDLVRGAADQQHHARVPPQRVAQNGVVAALVLAAENHQHISGEGVQRLERGVHVGGFGIVEIFHAGNRGDELNPVLHSREAAHALRDRGGLDSHQLRGCGRGQNIFNVVISAQSDIRAAKKNGFRTVAPENNFVITKETAAGNSFPPAEPEHLRKRRRILGSRRIVRVHDRASSAFTTAASSSV